MGNKLTNEDKWNNILHQLNGIQKDLGLNDYHAFIYWFLGKKYGLDKKEILDTLVDGTHDKGIDAIYFEIIHIYLLLENG